MFFNIQVAHSQNYRDTFSEKYSFSKDSAKVYSNNLIQSNDLGTKAFGFISKGYVLTKEGNYDKAKELFDFGFLEIDKIRNEEARLTEKLHALYYYSLFLVVKHEMIKANKKINEGLELSIKLKNAKLQIKLKNLIGRSYSLSNFGKEAIANGLETINSIRSLKSELSPSYYKDELLKTYLNTGYRTLNFFTQDTLKNASYLDSTASYLNLAQSFIKEEKFIPSEIRQRQLLSLQSDILYNKKDYHQAVKYYHQTLEISESLGLKKRVYQLKFRLAECYFHLGRYAKAKALFDKLSSVDLKQYILLKNAVSIKFYYAQIYAKLGNVEKALKYADTFNIQIEDFYKTVSSAKVDVFTQNELNNKKRILNDLAEKEKTNSYLTFLLSFIFMFSIALLFYVRNQRKKFRKKMNTLLEHIENDKKQKNISTIKVKETKAKKLLLKLTKIEEQELFLNKNYSLNMVAKKIDSNSSYVSQIINTYWNKSFVEYTNELRINYILKKLKEDKIYQKFTLLAVAESIGYKSLSSFNKHFKNIAGITPKQYLNYLKIHSEK
ncbi:MAG: helix-turn-helix domain-containing protein [Flavobacteriaceae bacterium]